MTPQDTTIRDDKDGESVFDADKINAQIKTIEDLQNDAYNLGIEHAIAIVQNSLIEPDAMLSDFHDEIISKLKKRIRNEI